MAKNATGARFVVVAVVLAATGAALAQTDAQRFSGTGLIPIPACGIPQ